MVRAIKRNILRNKVGNKGLRAAWHRINKTPVSVVKFKKHIFNKVKLLMTKASRKLNR
jgi:hypothetical protein